VRIAFDSLQHFQAVHLWKLKVQQDNLRTIFNPARAVRSFGLVRRERRQYLIARQRKARRGDLDVGVERRRRGAGRVELL